MKKWLFIFIFLILLWTGSYFYIDRFILEGLHSIRLGEILTVFPENEYFLVMAGTDSHAVEITQSLGGWSIVLMFWPVFIAITATTLCLLPATFGLVQYIYWTKKRTMQYKRSKMQRQQRRNTPMKHLK